MRAADVFCDARRSDFYQPVMVAQPMQAALLIGVLAVDAVPAQSAAATSFSSSMVRSSIIGVF
jgi:hypothetical protein